jgi:hypothetical protein
MMPGWNFDAANRFLQSNGITGLHDEACPMMKDYIPLIQGVIDAFLSHPDQTG